jgi:hypothetical protein
MQIYQPSSFLFVVLCLILSASVALDDADANDVVTVATRVERKRPLYNRLIRTLFHDIREYKANVLLPSSTTIYSHETKLYFSFSYDHNEIQKKQQTPRNQNLPTAAVVRVRDRVAVAEVVVQVVPVVVVVILVEVVILVVVVVVVVLVVVAVVVLVHRVRVLEVAPVVAPVGVGVVAVAAAAAVVAVVAVVVVVLPIIPTKV